MVVLVTGASGQLGQALQSIANQYLEISFKFLNSSELDIANFEQCKTVFSKVNPDFCINAAAYTAVDKAESEPEKAQLINVEGSRNLAQVCKEQDIVLLHISTDFIFDGTATKPYTEEDIPNPTGVYGQTKLDGEKAIQDILEKYFIIRTSWVYSEFGNNFMKTMLRLGSERDSLCVVNDQIGTPTNAVDLAKALLKIIETVDKQWKTDNRQPTTDTYGVYNFSNEGQCSWYDFAKKIFEVNKIEIDVQPIPTSAYPTPAKRPAFSVLDKSKIKNVFGVQVKGWEGSLRTAVIS
jgi:dTDP-4-dehydrorhamnose reductase